LSTSQSFVLQKKQSNKIEVIHNEMPSFFLELAFQKNQLLK